MAYTSVLPVHRLERSIDYVKDRTKTTKSAGSLEEAIDYALNREKTEQTIFEDVLWSSIFVTLMANKIGGLQFGIYRNCQISSRVFHTAVAALPLTKANRSDFE